MWTLDSVNAELSNCSLFWNSVSPAAKARTMNWADLVATSLIVSSSLVLRFLVLDFVRLPLVRVVAD
jgi:hypothetical protein